MPLDYNFNDLYSKLEELDKRISKDITDKALENGARPMLREMENVVSREVYKSGNLKRSLGILPIKGSGRRKKIEIGIKDNKDRSFTYGYYQEYGTDRMIGKKWMKKSFHNSVREANEEIKNTIKEGLRL